MLQETQTVILLPIRGDRDTMKQDAKNNQMTLSECAAFDYRTGQRDKLTGWGYVSRDRRERGISRKARRERRIALQAQANA